MLQITELQ